MTEQTAGNARRKKAGRRLTEQERAERREQDRETMDAATRALLDSEGWRRWVMVRSRNGLSRYSFGNQLLIAMQYPEATYVAGFKRRPAGACLALAPDSPDVGSTLGGR